HPARRPAPRVVPEDQARRAPLVLEPRCARHARHVLAVPVDDDPHPILHHSAVRNAGSFQQGGAFWDVPQLGGGWPGPSDQNVCAPGEGWALRHVRYAASNAVSSPASSSTQKHSTAFWSRPYTRRGGPAPGELMMRV